MRTGLFLPALAALVVAPGAAASPRDELAAVAQRAQATGARATNAALDKAAAYWFAADREDRRSFEGGWPALALAIRLARAEALRNGASPLPSETRRTLRPHYSDKVLDKARWIVAAPESRLGLLLARWPVRNGAVTVGEVIVFKTSAGARDRRLLAHELTHVDQYRRLGIDRFAERYSANRASLEEEARAKAQQVVKG